VENSEVYLLLLLLLLLLRARNKIVAVPPTTLKAGQLSYLVSFFSVLLQLSTTN
jgi:hypothetical protein